MILTGLIHDLQAGLFSAVVTASLARALDDLRPNYQQQTVLLLHQLLNGRDPNLANISDPTIPYKPAGSAIAVNCLWSVSLCVSLSASIGALVCKTWLAEYNSGANPVVGLRRACQRHVRFIAFQRLNVHTLVPFIPALLYSSVSLFFAGCIVYFWQIDERMAIAVVAVGGIAAIGFFLSMLFALVTNPLFHHYQISATIGKVVVRIVDVFAHLCYLTLRHIISAILFPFVRTIFSTGAPHRWYMQTRTIFPEYKHIRVWWADASNDPLDEINTSQQVQEEAILWLSQVPLDPHESKALVSSLALISSSRPYKFQKPVIVLANLVLEASLREGPGQEQTDASINCVIVLGNIKFQLAVDRNSDCDHNVGGTPVPVSVARVAQQLTINAFREGSDTPYSEEIRAQLLTAAAWLSPVDDAEDVSWDDEKLKIQGRYQFLQAIKIALQRHVNGEKVLDNNLFINLIRGMHACIPRGNYGSASLMLPFLPLV